jgi:hypothetical protein
MARVRLIQIVAVSVAVVAAFFVGLAVDGNPSGTAAEWFAGLGSFAAAAVAVGVAVHGTRTERTARHEDRVTTARRRELELAIRLLTLIETGRQEAAAQGLFPYRPAEATAIVYLLVARRVELGEALVTYYLGDGPRPVAATADR